MSAPFQILQNVAAYSKFKVGDIFPSEIGEDRYPAFERTYYFYTKSFPLIYKGDNNFEIPFQLKYF